LYRPSPLPRSHFAPYFSAPPRDLPSFPTRRSSDLPDPESTGASAVGLATITNDGTVLDTWFPQPKLTEASSTGGTTPLSDAEARDRKSTRLNSSHVSISYAVFCLKKKKKKHISRHH